MKKVNKHQSQLFKLSTVKSLHKWLSLLVFSSYENIVDRVSDAWNAFREDTALVKSMCIRSWIRLIT